MFTPSPDVCKSWKGWFTKIGQLRVITTQLLLDPEHDRGRIRWYRGRFAAGPELLRISLIGAGTHGYVPYRRYQGW
jgi:hypothetical protein